MKPKSHSFNYVYGDLLPEGKRAVSRHRSAKVGLEDSARIKLTESHSELLATIGATTAQQA